RRPADDDPRRGRAGGRRGRRRRRDLRGRRRDRSRPARLGAPGRSLHRRAARLPDLVSERPGGDVPRRLLAGSRARGAPGGAGRAAVPARVQRLGGYVAAAALVAAIVAGVGAFFVTVDRPGHYVQQKWETFKRLPPRQQAGSTHLLTLGSNRYDFWRVALRTF